MPSINFVTILNIEEIDLKYVYLKLFKTHSLKKITLRDYKLTRLMYTKQMNKMH